MTTIGCRVPRNPPLARSLTHHVFAGFRLSCDSVQHGGGEPVGITHPFIRPSDRKFRKVFTRNVSPWHDSPVHIRSVMDITTPPGRIGDATRARPGHNMGWLKGLS